MSREDVGSGFKFVSVANLYIANLTLDGCGTLHYGSAVVIGSSGVLKSAKFRSAIYILNSTNVTVETCDLINSQGKALSFHDTSGKVSISNSAFLSNAFSSSDNENAFKGGGIYIEYTYCTPGQLNCSPVDNQYNKNNSYKIYNCVFRDNKADEGITAHVHTVQFRTLYGTDGYNRGQGGGIGIGFKGTSAWNTISVSNCTFYNNSALYGGGMELLFQDFAMGNNVTLNGNRFVHNTALERAGGALQMGYVVTHSVSHNMIAIYNTEFTNNSAGWGGAVAFFSSRSPQDVKNKLIFVNCTWKGNSASFGAALAVLPDARNTIFDGTSPVPLLQNTTFIENRVVDEAKFLRSATNELSQIVLESGALHIDVFTVEVSHRIEFVRNSGSAVLANSAVINLLSDTTALFIGNTATNGGAMALLGFSILQVFPNSNITFESNFATELGGAIYATSSHQTEFIYSHKCFISYHNTLTHPDDWMSSLTFVNNTAEYGAAIFADSLLPCAKEVSSITTNVSETFRWKSFRYTPDIMSNTIATSPASINFTLPPDVAPGERINIHPVSVDDLQQTFPAVYQAHVESDSGDLKVNTYVSDGYIQIFGNSNADFTLTLQTVNTRFISTKRESRLVNCPLGFMLQNDACVCYSYQFVGILYCRTTSLEAYIHNGYWAGCIDNDTLVTAQCRTGYCSNSHSASQLTVLPRSCEGFEDKLCVSNRRGWLCGECEDGYTVFFHSENFKCGKCSYGAYGLLLYVIAEIIPLSLLFLAILFLQLNLASGLGQTFTFFVQVLDLMSYKSVIQKESGLVHALTRAFYFIFGVLNLDFFTEESLSFCLWKGATVLDNLTFKYVTTLFGIVLLIAVIIFFRYYTLESVADKLLCCPKLKRPVVKRVSKATPIVHGISTFLVLSFNQYTVTSFQLLARAQLYGKGEVGLKSVVLVSGNVEYFGKTHLQYALPALFAVLFLSIPPPLLLVSYPLLWRLRAKCKCNTMPNSDKTCWPIRKLLPLFDSFQGKYRDNCRFFSGLFFIWRVVITAIFSFSTSSQYYLLLELALLAMLLIHAAVGPYQNKLHNIADICMFADLLAINTLEWFMYTISYHNVNEVDQTAVVVVKLLMMYLPVVFMLLRYLTKTCPKTKWARLGYRAPPVEDERVEEMEAVACDEQLFARAEGVSFSSSYTVDSPPESSCKDTLYHGFQYT